MGDQELKFFSYADDTVPLTENDDDLPRLPVLILQNRIQSVNIHYENQMHIYLENIIPIPWNWNIWTWLYLTELWNPEIKITKTAACLYKNKEEQTYRNQTQISYI